jgi:hypothetical protein
MRYGSAAGIEEALELAVSARSNFARSIAMSESPMHGSAQFCQNPIIGCKSRGEGRDLAICAQLDRWRNLAQQCPTPKSLAIVSVIATVDPCPVDFDA